jgi:hypothetical protein
VADPSNSAAIQTWEINDGKVMAAMVNSVKQSMIMSLRKFKTAKAIWSHLKECYVQDSGALLHTLMQQTHAIEQKDMTIDAYYSAFDRLVGSLTSMIGDCPADGCPAHQFIEKFFIYRFVMGVRDEFDSICKRLLHDSSDLTMTHALSDLLAEETRLQSMSAPMSVPHNVLAASQKYSTLPKGTSSEPCKHCGKTNHSSENCFSQHPEKLADFRARRAARAVRGRGISVVAASPITAPQSSWVLDSGASFHVTSDRTQLIGSKAVSDGTSVIPFKQKMVYLVLSPIRVLFAHLTFLYLMSLVPQLSMNLLSVGLITDHNCFVGFNDSSCFVQVCRTGALIGTGHRRRGAPSLYILNTLRLPQSSARVSSAASSSTSSFAKWHHRLGHLCGSRLTTLINKGCLGHTSLKSNFHCKGCKLGKQIQLPYPSRVSQSARPFDLIHSDVWGPAPFATKGGHKYYVIFIDDHSRYTWVYFMKHRSQLCSIYQAFVRMVHIQFSTLIKVFIPTLLESIPLVFFAIFCPLRILLLSSLVLALMLKMVLLNANTAIL